MAMIEKQLIGIGFGPSNLALAVALAERPDARHLDAYFIERHEQFCWHQGMLIEGSRVQISFLKDLATLHNPRSHFTFINYLHATGRLQSFINLKQTSPTRAEFTDYFCWAAAAFKDRCSYGETVESVEPVTRNGRVSRLLVTSRTGAGERRHRLTRDLVVAVGGQPNIPALFAATMDGRVIHASRYVTKARPLIETSGRPFRVAVVGGGQSGAEIFRDIAERWPDVEVTLILRDVALRPADDRPFVNEVFDPGFVDVVHALPDERRQVLLGSLRNTNYSVVDPELIEHIYALLYRQRIAGGSRCRLLAHRRIEAVRQGESIELDLRDTLTDACEQARFDLVLLATGYRYDAHERLLAGLGADLGPFEVDRFYRLRTPPSFSSRIYLQGCNESSHGLSDTLLSILPLRASEIVDDLLAEALSVASGM